MVDSQLSREVVFNSVPENINLIESMMEDLKSEIQLSDETEANILVCLSEAVNNAIFHGNGALSTKKVTVNTLLEDKKLSFSIKDEGAGFNPENIKDPTAPENIDKPTGRGVFLMKNLADKVEFHDGGSKIIITFMLI